MMSSLSKSNSILSYILWLSGIILPVYIPWFIYKLFQNKRALDDLRGKVVLITGASSGLGEALAHVFFRAGCKVILASRNVDKLQRVQSDLLAIHSVIETYKPEIVELDISDIGVVPVKVQEAVEIHGCVDIVINNAGISFRGEIEQTSIEVDMQLMKVNYFGQVALTKAILRYMVRQRSGHIVCISSVQGRISIPFRSAYSAAKHATQAFYDCLRAEVNKYNIDVTVVSPGYIKTNLSLNALTGSGQKYGNKTTEAGYTPEEVADAILWSILQKKKDLTISSWTPKLAIYLRTLCPSLYFYVMSRRAKKEQ